MCFSATASFVASGGLAIVGVASLRIATKKQIIIAAIPLLFAIQQMFEGFQWLSISSGHTNPCAGYGFALLALVVWPVYLPLAVYMLDKQRRHVTKWFLALGTALSAYFMTILVLGSMQIVPMKLGIYYKIDMLLGLVTAPLYVIATCGSLLASSLKFFRIFGIATFVSVFITIVFFARTFTSTWCFFSAILSVLIYIYLVQNRKNKQ
jgi:hypothetical protein